MTFANGYPPSHLTSSQLHTSLLCLPGGPLPSNKNSFVCLYLLFLSIHMFPSQSQNKESTECVFAAPPAAPVGAPSIPGACFPSKKAPKQSYPAHPHSPTQIPKSRCYYGSKKNIYRLFASIQRFPPGPLGPMYAMYR